MSDEELTQEEGSSEEGEQQYEAPAEEEPSNEITDDGSVRAAFRRVDLTGKERQLRAAVVAMTRIAQDFARACRRSMPFLVRYKCMVVPGSVESLGTGADFAGESNENQFFARLGSPDGRAFGAVSLDAGAIQFVLEGALGGRGPLWSQGEGSALSLAQRALLTRIVNAVAEDLSHAVEGEVGLKMLVTDPDIPVNVPAAGDVLRVTCTIEGLEVPATLTIAASAQALEVAAKEQSEPEQPLAGDPRVADMMQSVPLVMVAELGRVTLGLRKILSLRPGDIIRLPTATDDPLSVRVAGVQKFTGVPVVSRGQLAIEIRARHEG